MLFRRKDTHAPPVVDRVPGHRADRGQGRPPGPQDNGLGQKCSFTHASPEKLAAGHDGDRYRADRAAAMAGCGHDAENDKLDDKAARAGDGRRGSG